MKANKPASKNDTAPAVSVKETHGSDKPVQKTFPGPRGAGVSQRVAIARQPHAELIAHAKESLDAEVCGVLVGQLCEDDEGSFVEVSAVIRGAQASGGSTHVTFTQATWTTIHETMDQKYPKLRIVGWYHTHPGFGVEFSEMDLFIQRNFFSGPGQIALVTDPLSGAVAIAANQSSASGGITYLPKYWVDGREHPSWCPPQTIPSGNAADPQASSGPHTEALEQRVAQLTHALDDLRESLYRFLLFAGLLVCVGVVAVTGWMIYSMYKPRIEPPQMHNFVPVPVQIGDKKVLLGVNVVSWEVPPELNALLLDLEKEKQAESKEKPAPEATSPDAPKSSPTPANPQ